MTTEHFDVLIVGAGISGIGAGYHLKARSPSRSYVILENRDAIGGTWDLFRYPGIRSDSDMYTLGYSFRPWRGEKAIADGESIREYVRDTAREHGIDQHIRFRHRVQRAEWSSEEARWTISAERGEGREPVRFTCSFLFLCAGYYNYESGYTPELPGMLRFQGRIVHPQKWTSDIDYEGKRVVVIGSGATAMTLVPELAKKAAHVTMLQRSPTYVVSRPAADGFALALRRYMPERVAYWLTRWKQVLLGMLFFRLARKYPRAVKRRILEAVEQALPGYDVKTHFTPRYNPWDQRMCLVPDGDLFEAIRAQRASVVTDHIETITEQGVALRSGQQLEADLIITATGLELVAMGGLDVHIDGKRFEPAGSLAYKGMMYCDVPNLASSFGYTNASWTLKCDLTCEYVCRLLNYMQKHGYAQCTPRRAGPVVEQPWLDFSSGYVQRSLDKFPKQGDKAPWRLYQNYALDLVTLRYGKVDDGTMEFRAR
jgi:cation diffusion facilitator CzcD-associated flavoprotein CzcO